MSIPARHFVLISVLSAVIAAVTYYVFGTKKAVVHSKSSFPIKDAAAVDSESLTIEENDGGRRGDTSTDSPTVRISALYVYPIKSCAGIEWVAEWLPVFSPETDKFSALRWQVLLRIFFLLISIALTPRLTEATLCEYGIVGDRTWVVAALTYDQTQLRMITSREVPQLSMVQPKNIDAEVSTRSPRILVTHRLFETMEVTHPLHSKSLFLSRTSPEKNAPTTDFKMWGQTLRAVHEVRTIVKLVTGTVFKREKNNILTSLWRAQRQLSGFPISVGDQFSFFVNQHA